MGMIVSMNHQISAGLLLAGFAVGCAVAAQEEGGGMLTQEEQSGDELRLVVTKAFREVGGAQQGIATDGAHVYVQSTSQLVKYDMRGTVLAEGAKLDWHHGGITYGDGMICAAVSECSREGTDVHWVYVYDAETLEKVAEYDIGEHFSVCAGGIAHFEGHFYVAESYFDNDHNDYLVEFDAHFNHVESHSIDFKCPYGIQGLDYLPSINKFMVTSHGREFYLIDTDFDSATIAVGLAPFELQDVACLNVSTILCNDRAGKQVVFAHVEGVGAPAQEKPDMPTSVEETPLSNAKARIYEPGRKTPAKKPIHLSPGPHLLIDDYLIESSANVGRVVNVPERGPSIPNPIVTGKEDGCFQPYMTVIREPQTGRFRLWYGHRTDDFNSGRSQIGYLESEDGVHWQRPVRILQEPGPIQFGISVIDEGEGFPHPPERFKFGWWMDGGLKVAASPDGLTWTPMTAAVVLRHNHDINSISYDPLRKRYVATASVYRPGGAWSGNRRITMQSYSADLLHWSAPHYVVLPDDAVDQGETQFYAMEGYLVRGDLIIGMVKVLRDDLKADAPPDPPEAYGVGYTTLAWTRDGETWTRDPEHFFDPNPQKGTWDHAHAWIDEQVLVDDEVFLYYGGYARGHKVNRFEERQIGLVKMKRDRYVAREARGETGRILTPLVTLDGDAMALNVDAEGGSVAVGVLDEENRPIPGFAMSDCRAITTNALDAPVAWKRPLADLKRKPVRLEFSLENARLFAFELN